MKILFVNNTRESLNSVTHGAAQRTFLLLEACVKCADKLDFVTFCDEEFSLSSENFETVYNTSVPKREISKFRRVILKIWWFIWGKDDLMSSRDSQCERVLDEIISKGSYDLIVTRYLPRALEYGLLKYSNRLVVDIDDNPVSVLNSSLGVIPENLEKAIRPMLYRKLLHIYERNVSKLKLSFFSNPKDLRIERSVYLPNIPYYEKELQVCSFDVAPPRVLFVGLLNYKPNFDGVVHFVNNVWALIKKEVPDAVFSVVGKNNEVYDFLPQGIPGVEFKGFVEDIVPEYLNSRVVVVPCYNGGGTNIKVLESMRMRRPVVTTDVGFRGYESVFEKNKDIFVCQTDKDFAEKVILMLANEINNHSVSNCAFDAVTSFFSRKRFYQIVSDSLSDNH